MTDDRAVPAGVTRDCIAPTLAGLVEELRRAGVPVMPADTVALHEAVVAAHQVPLYWCARFTLVRAREHLPVFDLVFARHFGDPGPVDDGLSESGVEVEQESPAADSDSEDERMAGVVSAERVPHDRDFRDMSSDEVRAAAAVVAEIARERLPRRRTRARRSRRGAVDLRRATRAVLRPGADPGRLPHHRRRTILRPVVVVLDVSHSMEPYVVPWAAFASVLVQTLGRAHVGVFCVGTDLTDVTVALADDRPDVLARAMAAVSGAGSGTRLATCVGELVERVQRDRALRGGTVLVVSDGLDSEPPELLATAMHALRPAIRRLVWCTPLLGDPQFAPIQRSLAAALPYVDDLVAAHDVDSLRALCADVAETVLAGR